MWGIVFNYEQEEERSAKSFVKEGNNQLIIDSFDE